MKASWLLLVIILLTVSVALPIGYVQYTAWNQASNENFFFGVACGSNTSRETKLLIDKVKGYTNLFVVDSWDVSTNETALTEICQYAVDAGMSVIVYFDFIFYNVSSSIGSFYNASTWEQYGVTPWHIPWLNNARENWGKNFLGVYLYDEPGGNQIDRGYW